MLRRKMMQDEYKANDAGNEETNDIGKYKTDIKEQTLRVKNRQMMISDRKKLTKMMQVKADHRMEAVHDRKDGKEQEEYDQNGQKNGGNEQKA